MLNIFTTTLAISVKAFWFKNSDLINQQHNRWPLVLNVLVSPLFLLFNLTFSSGKLVLQFSVHLFEF